jgi:hypothetical protein
MISVGFRQPPLTSWAPLSIPDNSVASTVRSETPVEGSLPTFAETVPISLCLLDTRQDVFDGWDSDEMGLNWM